MYQLDRTSCLQQGRTFPGGVHFIVYWCACAEFLGQIEKCYHFPNQGSGAHTVRLSGFSPPFFLGSLDGLGVVRFWDWCAHRP